MSLATHAFRLKPRCDQKTLLRTAYQSALDRHDLAVGETVRARGKVPTEVYERLRALEDQARASRNAARLALEQHKQEHGC